MENTTDVKQVVTKGQYRVGVSFNPSNNPLVDEIKWKTSDLIDLCDRIANADVNPEVKRLAALAQTHFEDAAMWGVKAATTPAQP